MGVNISKCCCCEDPCELKQITLGENNEIKNEFYSNPREIIDKLESAKEKLIGLLNQDIEYFYISEKFNIGVLESEKGHILKVFFTIPKNYEEACKILNETERKTWDKLIEIHTVLEKNENFTVDYLKYKSQLTYSAKEVLIAKHAEKYQEGALVYYTSIPEKIQTGSNKINVFEGGYYIQGNSKSTLTLIVHFYIGGNSLTKLLQKLSEKCVQDSVDSILALFSQ